MPPEPEPESAGAWTVQGAAAGAATGRPPEFLAVRVPWRFPFFRPAAGNGAPAKKKGNNMTIKRITFAGLEKMGLPDLEDIENRNEVYVCESGEKRAWFYRDLDGCFCSCWFNGLSYDSPHKQDVIDFIGKAIT